MASGTSGRGASPSRPISPKMVSLPLSLSLSTTPTAKALKETIHEAAGCLYSCSEGSMITTLMACALKFGASPLATVALVNGANKLSPPFGLRSTRGGKL